MQLEGNYVEQSKKIKLTVQLRILFLFHIYGFESNTPRKARLWGVRGGYVRLKGQCHETFWHFFIL